MRILLALLCSLLLAVSGCGGDTNSPDGYTIGGPSGEADAPAPNPPSPGSTPTPIPLTTIQVVNTSGWAASELAQAIADINQQLQIVGAYWGTNTQLELSAGPFDPSIPSIVISNNPNPPGQSASGQVASSPAVVFIGGSAFVNYSQVLAEGENPEADLSHAALLVTGAGPAIGEAYEATDYPSPSGGLLADWAFPSPQVSPITGQLSDDYAGAAPVTAGGP